MAESKFDMRLPSADDLFSTQEMRDDAKREKVAEIPINEIVPFENHPFKVRNDDDMKELTQSVKEYGVLVPAIVRPKESGGYEMIAGHRRVFASQFAGKDTIPAICRNLSDEEATLIMVDSNLQRERIQPSEKAFAYKMKLDAMKRQGKRTDLTSSPLETKLRSDEILSKEVNESRAQIQRYIRLTELLPEILEYVDNDKIGLRPAVELSYLRVNEQEALLETIESEQRTPSHAQAIRMRELSKLGKLGDDVIFAIMTEEKPNERQHIKLKSDAIKKYFSAGTSDKVIEDTIVKALEEYRKRQRAKER